MLECAKNIPEIWGQFIDDNMIYIVVDYTNLYIDKIKKNRYSGSRDVNYTYPTKFRAFLRLIYVGI